MKEKTKFRFIVEVKPLVSWRLKYSREVIREYLERNLIKLLGTKLVRVE